MANGGENLPLPHPGGYCSIRKRVLTLTLPQPDRITLMNLAVLNIACPFACVGPNGLDSAEQLLAQLDFSLSRGGVFADSCSTSSSMPLMPRLNSTIERPIERPTRRSIADARRRSIGWVSQRR